MKIDAVGVTSRDMQLTVAFYKLLGFEFGEVKPEDDHVEPLTPDGSARLMVDSDKLSTELLGEAPKPGNHSSFAILYDLPADVDQAAAAVKAAGYTLVKAPWDAFWGQRYAIVEDPDGYKVDLFAALS